MLLGVNAYGVLSRMVNILVDVLDAIFRILFVVRYLDLINPDLLVFGELLSFLWIGVLWGLYVERVVLSDVGLLWRQGLVWVQVQTQLLIGLFLWNF
jgi:hypothetical protein